MTVVLSSSKCHSALTQGYWKQMRMIGKAILITTILGILPWAGALAASSISAGEFTLRHDELERRYVVRMPPGMEQNDGLLPLVLVLHGGGGNASNVERTTGFTLKAETEGFVVVYPEGTGRFKRKLLTWNAGHCCGRAMHNRVDDVGFISSLLDRLLADYPVDPERVYVTGLSNGGMMSHRLGIELAHRFTAIAPVIATVFGDEPWPAQPVSAVMVNGMLDKSMPLEGGPTGGKLARAWDGTPTQPTHAQAEFWAAASDCADMPQRIDRGQVVLTRYACPAGRSVELYLVKDNGHAWPGGQKGYRRGDVPSMALNATDIIWTFFSAHSKPVNYSPTNAMK